MAKKVVIDELHVTLLVPARSSKTDVLMLRTLRNKRFQARLREAVGNVIRQYASLKTVSFSISR